jgi:tetratricopeptide (TPR) repeat protein
VTTKR